MEQKLSAAAMVIQFRPVRVLTVIRLIDQNYRMDMVLEEI